MKRQLSLRAAPPAQTQMWRRGTRSRRPRVPPPAPAAAAPPGPGRARPAAASTRMWARRGGGAPGGQARQRAAGVAATMQRRTRARACARPTSPSSWCACSGAAGGWTGGPVSPKKPLTSRLVGPSIMACQTGLAPGACASWGQAPSWRPCSGAADCAGVPEQSQWVMEQAGQAREVHPKARHVLVVEQLHDDVPCTGAGGCKTRSARLGGHGKRLTSFW